jgi:hypothetical protein
MTHSIGICDLLAIGLVGSIACPELVRVRRSGWEWAIIAMLLVAGDKSGVSQKRFYQQLIKKADRRFTMLLEEGLTDLRSPAELTTLVAETHAYINDRAKLTRSISIVAIEYVKIARISRSCCSD